MAGIHLAVTYCDDETELRRLFYECPDIDVRYDGETPLHAATDAMNEVAVRFLLNHGACVNARAKDGRTPLHNVCRHMSSRIYTYPTRTYRQISLDMIVLLMAEGADVNAKTRRGITPLHLVAECRRLDAMQMLIDNGADVNAADNKGRSILHACVVYDYVGSYNSYDRTNKDMVQLLLSKGADVNAKDQRGFTPLSRVAFSEWDVDVALLLVEKGARPCERSLRMLTDGVSKAVELEEEASVAKVLFGAGCNARVTDLQEREKEIEAADVAATDMWAKIACGNRAHMTTHLA